jgi:hypothetical protein
MGHGIQLPGRPARQPYTDRRNPASGFANFPFLFNQDGVPSALATTVTSLPA